MFWGLTPVLDFFTELNINPKCNTIDDDHLPDTLHLNILIVGGVDARHVLKTMSQLYRHDKNIHLNFYIIELVPEVIIKELLLLNVALQPLCHLGSVHKTRMFMEIYGNTLVRPITSKYLFNRTQGLMNMLTNKAILRARMPNVILDLKHKEIDYIENVLRFWMDNSPFDILDCWDRRLRRTLGVRYDTRNAAFDWDLHMRLHHVGAPYLNTQEYQSFRRAGVAFSWMETEVGRTNRSLVTGVVPNGDAFGHYGYLGDMATGPFIAYGTDCVDPEFKKKANMRYKYRATDITERNLREIFHELELGTEYEHSATSSITLGSTVMRISENNVVDTGNVATAGKYNEECFEVPRVSINFMSVKQLSHMRYKEKFKGFFQLMYFAYNCIPHVNKEVVTHVSADGSVLIVENQLFIPSLRDKELQEHLKVVEEKLEGVDKAPLPLDITKDAYIKYVLK